MLHVTPTNDGITRGRERGSLLGDLTRQPELVQALKLRGKASGALENLLEIRDSLSPEIVDRFASRVLVVPRSDRWREAVTTASLGSWCDPLFDTGYLSPTALGALKAEARAVHRQLVPVWRRRTRAGRVLSLDADLGDGLSLYDLVAADVDLLSRTAAGVFEDQRLNTVLRGLAPSERAVVFAHAENEGTTWTEAATVAGASEPKALGERVRRKTRRLAAEHNRRMVQRQEQAVHAQGSALPPTTKDVSP
ncbi:hypothetical protein ACFC5X_19875 [Streptomyces sp. NPDC055952]|uniref:hypothetical protein n=1 Tax=Streptomyces sp. NPDC055952 TaxID=3345663 RepID=UPI0035D57ADB